MVRPILLAAALVLSACGPARAASGLDYLGQRQMASGAQLDGTVIGGLSGISYDPAADLYYIISDDRSAKNPARFYTARIMLSDNSIDDIEFVGTHPWLDRDAQPFGPLNIDAVPPVVPPDPEAIAFDARRQRLYWTSEGERRVEGPGVPLLLDPWVRTAGLDGGYRGEFALPDALRMSADEHGARRNSTLEGLTLTPDGRHLWAAMEGPGYDDGPLPDEQHGARTRVIRFDADSGVVDGQYTYPLDPVSAGPGGDNGLSDLVALDDGTFLVIERGYGTHVAVRIYRASLVEGSTEMAKTLLADLTTTPGLTPLDNIEGITLGPKLPDGRQSVIAVSDDNFSPTQVTQFVLFAL
ncbi:MULTISPECIES: esterase-like activity of phytase family protein [unclassified Mycolicibacterium]|uniref:esterase-like activity of phytase family protein n=1 Tax=unclassified Mycolicibacterium TaxID=2636767 RepID=UPI0012DFBCD8|nr:MULTISPECIES: esterase-like activity of phytase family protein [unclassified Mycolicibacterium]MUL83689.1 esterase-like activity of phytase family protein [Mycolicibacterium sp. CBMA 329]MUL90680.1 esterase-like activity of phytase family protein [Mycolicibacterium sp. CBMA 331]MUM00649.1 esterase-like activity of phytase family protein [Mycolicibacterium sp. CBMA 334]MUM29880.1 esterase-like activity of phytase family protein [Mycolicibacterium sp. CBMA 295]MUM41624.1 esterase-like activit